MSEPTEEPQKGRTAAQIIEEICLHPETALSVLAGLSEDEHNGLTHVSFLVAIQRARGLACYETIAAYLIGADHEGALASRILKQLQSRGDKLFGMLNSQAMFDKVLSDLDLDSHAGIEHLRSLEG